MHGNPAIRTEALSAFILCGGRGMRLRPLVTDRPKSMALISGTPFLQLLIESVRLQGITDVILGTGYMAENIQDHFGDGENFGVCIRYSREHEPLGTGGSLKLAEHIISDPILVLNGDSYVDWRLTPMLELFSAKDAAAVIVVQAVPDISRYGSVMLNSEDHITQFVEKGLCAGPGLINAGVYLMRKEVVRGLPAATAISLERDVFPALLDRGLFGLACMGLFIDIGMPDDFRRAQTLLASKTKVAVPQGDPHQS